jgi:hypothetical protein
MPLDLFLSLDLREKGFGLDTELTAILLRLGVRPFEVPVSYYSRSHAQGKKINAGDAVDCLHILFRVRTRRKSRLTKRVAAAAPAIAPATAEVSSVVEASIVVEAPMAVEAPMTRKAAAAAQPDDAVEPEPVPVLNGSASRA